MPVFGKHIFKLISGQVKVSGFTAVGTSNVVTTAITTALNTAGHGGSSVPLRVSTASVSGVITTGANNRCEVYHATTKAKIKDGSGNEVYARLTESSNVYTLTYFSLVAGVETAYTFASTSIDFDFGYRFEFGDLPDDFAISVTTKNVANDPSSSGSIPFSEVLFITGTNTIDPLTKTPLGAVKLFVNNLAYSTIESPAPFTVSGKVITWSAVNAGFPLATTDKTYAEYFTNE